MLKDHLCILVLSLRHVLLQINVFLNRLNGEPIGYTLVGIIVIDKNAILTVRTTHRLFSSALRFRATTPCPGKNGHPKQNAVQCTVYNTIQ